MYIVAHTKMPQGSMVLDIRDDYVPSRPTPNARLYLSMFEDVPLIGGAEWISLSVEEIEAVFRLAAEEIRMFFEDRRTEEVWTHSRKRKVVQLWEELLGWTPPEVPTEKELFSEMAVACKYLAEWIQNSRFGVNYATTEMLNLVVKPQEVARRLVA